VNWSETAAVNPSIQRFGFFLLLLPPDPYIIPLFFSVHNEDTGR
jgi:hypothetical protein